MNGGHRVVIVGGGFGGLYAARALRKAPVDVTLLDRRNFHLFQPLLYQVATGGLSPANIASPLRSILSRQRNARVLMAEVVGFDLDGKKVLLRNGEQPYDSLIVAAGAGDWYFNHPEWRHVAPGLKSIEEATELRRCILSAFEVAERTADPAAREECLTFVIVGGGPTGVEMAGAIAELAHTTLRRDFRSINTASARILLLEGQPRVLPSFAEKLSAKAARQLGRLGVTVLTDTLVTDMRPGQVTYRTKPPAGAAGEAVERTVRARTAFWAAGVRASPLAEMLGKATGAEVDRGGRVRVQQDLSLPGRPEVFVIGDMADYPYQTGKSLPGVAQVAMQQGGYVAGLLARRLEGGQPPPPFRYHDKGSMATIGRAAAVCDLGWVRFNGRLAWLAWLFVHILFLIGFQNRVLVMLQWAYSYFSRNRAARLITWQEDDK